MQLLQWVGRIAAVLVLARVCAAGWTVRNWTTRDGMAVNSVNAVLQGKDGYLWIASFDGLMRFDGRTFRTWDASIDHSLPSNRLTSMQEDRDGNLWLSTEQHQLVRFDGERFRTFDRVAGPAGSLLIALARSSDGTVFAATMGGVARIERGEPREIHRAAGYRVESIHPAGGTVWIGTNRGTVIELRGGAARTHGPFGAGARVLAVRATRNGDVYAGAGDRIVRIRNGEAALLGPPLAGVVLAIDEDGRGGVSVIAGDRLYRVTQDAVTGSGPARFPMRREQLTLHLPGGRHVLNDTEQLFLDDVPFFRPGGAITSMTLDAEGSMWIGTASSGLFQISASPVQTIDAGPDRNLYAVVETSDGSVWVGSQNGGATRLSRDLRPAATFGADRGVGGGLAWAVGERSDGTIWIGGAGLCRVDGSRCVRDGIDARIGSEWVRAIFEDSRRRLWIGAANGIYCLEGGRWRVYRDIEGAPPTAIVRAILEDRDGTLWMATNGAGILRFRDGRFTRISTRDGLASNEIRDLHRDGGALWVGTENRGLCRIADGKIVCKDRGDGLYDNVIHRMLDDGHGRFWMSTNRGIFAVRAGELRAFFDGSGPPPAFDLFTEADGMRNREANGGVQSAGTRRRNGQLLFPTQAGLVVADPRAVQPLPDVVRVAIESVESQTGKHPALGLLTLPKGDRELRVAYTGLSFTDPARLEFRYRLGGEGEPWFDAGARREATFTNLRPGRHVFRVAARYPAHAWNAASERTLAIEVPPLFYETRSFFAALLAWIVVATWIAIRIALRRANARAAELERRVAERTRQLEEIGEARTRFFANVSHELRTPLTILAGGLEAAEETGRPPSPAEHAAMLRNARRLRRLVDQILDLEKIDAHAFRLHVAEVELGDLLRRVVHSFEAVAARRGLRLSCDPPPVSWTADPEQLERVIANLVSNAIKFSPRGAAVTVALTVDRERDEARIEVLDEGPGIAPEDSMLIFERFYQADSSDASRHEGTGIGLALSRELVELHGGSVVHENRVPRGCCFRVTLPRRPPAVAAEDPDANPLLVGAEMPPAEETTTVLVIDDNADLRAHVRRVLEPAYRVIEAHDGEEGLRIAQRELPDLVLADVSMPGMNGLELARCLRADERIGATPLIFLSARTTETDQIRGIAAGGDEYITKPFSALLLRAKVAGMLRSRLRLRAAAPVPATAPRGGAAEPELAAKIRAAVLELMPTGDLSVQRVAEHLAMDRTWLFRRVREELGRTPAELIREMRLDRAAELLARGDANVSEVAYAVGFASVAHFSRAFRERHGKPPSAWRSAESR